jgi:recombination protein RecA
MARRNRLKQMEQTVSAIQQRWGPRAIRPARKIETPTREDVLSTGFAHIDHALRIGGFPKGRISELLGSGTAGQVTLAAKTLYEAQLTGQQVVYIDAHQAIDLDFLHRCGVYLEPLVVLRPFGFRHALEMADDLIRGGGAGAILFDRIHPMLTDSRDLYLLERALGEWQAILNRSLCTLLILTETLLPDHYPAGPTLPHFASIRLGFNWQYWLYQKRQVIGFVSHVTILKNRSGPTGQRLPIRVIFRNHIHGGADE